MDVLEGPYYRINRFLLHSLGQWPYQRTLYKFFFRMIYATTVLTMVIPEVLRLIEVWGELEYVIEVISILGVQLANIIKLSNYVLNVDKIKKLMYRIRKDWESDMFKPHREIFERYATEGRRLTTIYTVCMYSTLGTFVTMPVMPIFLDIVMPLNESRPPVYPIPVKYGDIDPKKYYFPMIMHANFSSFLAITTIVAMDTTYTVYVQHACGLFTAVGDRLQRLMDLNDRENRQEIAQYDKISQRKQEEVTYRGIVKCIKMHKEAIEFATIIESSHVVVFFFVIGLSVFCMSVAGFQMVMNMDQPNEAIRFLVFTLAQVAHIFFISWPGEKLIDHSGKVYQWVYGARWYQVSPRSQKLLMLMMMRSVEPCKLTAGKLYDMSLANFSMVMKTSMSYFTMLTSFR